jgi:hypothetical protein
MVDYVKNEDYAAKDALLSGDPEKAILGTDLGGEFDDIATAITSKYDAADIATQPQAEAGTNNTTMMTPLRVAQAITGLSLGDGSGGAGILADLELLADPNADRILFWDDSEGAAAFLTASTGLTISGASMTTNDAQIVHDSLSGFVANEHIDHSSVSIATASGSSGLTGGGTIAATRNLSVDIDGTTVENTINAAADKLLFWDDSAGALRGSVVANFVGSTVGSMKAQRATSVQAISAATETTVIFNSSNFDTLARGAYSTVTGQYTASAVTRLMVTAKVMIVAMDDDDSIQLQIQVDGTTDEYFYHYEDSDNDTPNRSVQVMGIIDCPNGTEVVRVRVETSSAENLSSALGRTTLNILELF